MFETVDKAEENLKPTVEVQEETFCPRCGSFLKVTARRGQPLISCPKCGYNKPVPKNETPKQNLHIGRSIEIAVIDKKKEASLRTFPTVNVQCPVCGKNESETWTMAVGGETTNSTITFLRCTSCGNTRRESG
jgi:transcription factor S